MTPPAQPKLYHILHVDRLAGVIRDGSLFSDAAMQNRRAIGTTIGLSDIKNRRLASMLVSLPGLAVGQCVPFYFCPRSVMLYVLHRGNLPGLTYYGGQRPIVHLEFNLRTVVEWCGNNNLRWAFTLSNAGSRYFEDRSDLAALSEINWAAVQATDFRDPDVKEGKQAEFLVEKRVSWELVEQVGVAGQEIATRVYELLDRSTHRPRVAIRPQWYF